MTTRNPSVSPKRPLATSSPGSEASPRTNQRPRRATKLPERYRPGDSSYSSPAHTPSTSSPAPPTDSPIVAQGSRWFTILQPLKPGERPETLREARIRQGLPLNGPLPVIRTGVGWAIQLEPAPDKDSPEQQKKPVTPSRQQIRESMVGKKPRRQVAAKTYRGADTGDAMEVEKEQNEASGVDGLETEQHDGVDDLEEETGQPDDAHALNVETEQHDNADPLDLEMANDDGVTDTPASSPLSEPMSDNALEALLKTPAEESETSSSEGELPPHPAFTGQELALGAFKYLAKHLQNNEALDVLNQVGEPAFPRHRTPPTVHSPTPPPPPPSTTSPPAAFSLAALSHTASLRAISRQASLRPASLQPLSSPPGSSSPIDSPQAPSPSELTPRTASPRTIASPSAVSRPTSPLMPLARTTSPAPMASPPSPSPLPPPPITTSTSTTSSTPSPPQFHLSPAPHHQNPSHGGGPVWSDWIALWAGTSYVPDHERDVLDTIPDDGPYFDCPVGQIQTVNALCATETGDVEAAGRAKRANFVVGGVGGRYMRTRQRR